MQVVSRKTLIKRWLAGLRSGKYKQAKGVLRSANNGFCCLGVVIDIADPSSWSEKPTAKCGKAYCSRHGNPISGDRATTLSFTFAKRLGLSPNCLGTLIDMNDNGSRFKTIASYIERYFKEHPELLR